MIETEEYVFEFDADKAILRFIWKDKSISKVQFKEILLKFALLSAELRPTFLLVDARLNFFKITKDVQVWHEEVIIPLYGQAEIKAVGFVSPIDVFSLHTHKQTFEQEKAIQSFPTEFFKSEAEVLNWFERFG
jgi:hypothetical protein